MKHRVDRRILACVILGVAACALTAWSVSRWSNALDAVQHAAEDLRACQSTARRLAAAQTQPTIASADTVADHEIAALVERAAQQVGLPPDRVSRIRPQPPRRITRTPYLELATRIEVDQATLRQSISLLDALRRMDSGLSVQALRLSAPRGAENEDLWRLDATVRHLIYEPQDES